MRLPGERCIIVDTKVPDFDVLNALEMADGEKRAAALAAHAAKMKATIKALADNDYPHRFPNALDYVVLFLPAEWHLSAALEGDEELIFWAVRRRILLATPTSFIAIFMSIGANWKLVCQIENAKHIAQAAQELYSRVGKFTEDFEKIGVALRAFETAEATFQTRVRPAGERLVKLVDASSPIELEQPFVHHSDIPPAR